MSPHVRLSVFRSVCLSQSFTSHAPIGYNLLVAFLVGIQQAATGIALEARLVWVEHLHSSLLEIMITAGE